MKTRYAKQARDPMKVEREIGRMLGTPLGERWNLEQEWP